MSLTGSFGAGALGAISIASGATLVMGDVSDTWSTAPADTVTSYTVSAGVTVDIGDEGGVTSATIGSGGLVNVDGWVIGTTVDSGGTLVQTGEGVVQGASGTILDGGAFELGMGVASGTTVLSGGVEFLSNFDAGSPCVAMGTTVLSGGEEIIGAAASASWTTVGAGGVRIISASGSSVDWLTASAIGTTVESGGLEIVGGSTVNEDGYTVMGGAAWRTVVLGGGQVVVSSGGQTFSATVSSGGTVGVLSGGRDSFNTILGGATEIMQGWGYDTTVDSGGVEVVASGGLASGTLLAAGATLVVSSGGLALGTGIGSVGYASAGEIIVNNGGTESAGWVLGSAVEIVASGGTAISEDVLLGGREVVQSGGVATNLTLNDGTLEVASGSLTSGQLTFGQSSAGSTLVLDAGASLNALVPGFGVFEPGYGTGVKPDEIDLQGIAFGTTKKSSAHLSFTEAAGNLSGTLAVTDGVHTVSIQLLGQYTASEFAAASDGNGGTLITYTSATQPGGHLGHSNTIASPVTS